MFDGGGGTWTSANTAIATVGSSTGVVTGVSSGTTLVTYTLPTGCYTTTTIIVSPNPGPITGNLNVCVGSNDTLSDTSTGGLWSSSDPTIAYIDPITGIITGMSSGSAIITYALSGGTGCFVTTTVNVNPLPGVITGVPSVCVGQTTSLFDGGGGTWSSSNTAVATIGSSSGLVFGVSVGFAIINYTLPTGCATSIIVTVNPGPAAISGPPGVCSGLTATMTDATFGGTWSITPTGIATIGSSTGIVTGVSVGCATITYKLPSGCYVTAPFCVTGAPAPITGTLNVCVGSTTTLSDLTPGGTWTSSAPGTATVGSTTGIVSGITAGLATITYAIGTGCQTTAVVTVNNLPSAIGGPSTVCPGSTITLTSSAGVTWSSSNTAIATVGAGTGVVTGVTTGIVTITATNPLTNCSRSKTVTVNPLPSPISGLSTVCAGSTILLADISGGGTWSSSSGVIATVGSSTGIVTGVNGGTATISYTLPTGCFATKLITVNPLPTPCTVTGGGNYCSGGPGVHVGLSCSVTGLSYQLLLGGVAVGSPLAGTGLPLDFGLQTAAGTYTVIATNSTTGCSGPMSGSATIGINPAPTPIGGPSALCVGATMTVTSTPPGGHWTSSAPAVATIGSITGIVTGITTGTSTIAYTLPTGCSATKVVTVSLSPGPILGPGFACTGTSITTLIDTVSGGTWTSSTTTVATIGSLSGVVTGGALTGTTVITYSLGSGCTVTKTLTVYASPAAITGPASLCQGQATTYGDVTPGGLWGSSVPATATIVATSGFATAVAPGTTIIAYTVPSGCSSTVVLTVNPLPGLISGIPQVCVGGTTTLGNSVPGGSWSSGAIAVATINPVTGLVTGVTAGTATITYLLGSGCIATRVVTVNPLPLAITGTAHVCIGLSTTLADGTPGGTWGHSTPVVATLAGSTETGLSSGTDTVTYTLSVTGCATKQVVTVNPVPTPISGPSGVCVGQTIVLTDGVPGGTWSSGTPAVATIGSTTGIVTGVSFGSTIITYSSGGCQVTATVNVISSPLPVTGPTHVCVGGTITLSDASPGGHWTSSMPTEATAGSSTGIVTGIASGTVIISYTLGSTGCTQVAAIVVNPISPILGTPVVCVGQTTTLVDTTLGGSWSSSNPGIGTISGAGIVTGIAAGTTTISYSLGTGCAVTVTVTVNGIPPAISGPGAVCAGQDITETDTAPGGIWSSSDVTIATISTTGVVTGVSAGTVLVSYTIPSTGCPATKTVTVNPVPSAISGPTQLCVGGTITLSDPSGGGVWLSTTPATAGVGAISGIVTGVSAGTAVISYSYSTGCGVSTTVTVNPSVPPLSGPTQYCVGATVSLSSSVPGGTWSSSNPAVVTPALYCGGTGTSTITYTVMAGCAASAVVTVNNLPSAIMGSTNVCVGGTTALTDATGSGTWGSSDITIADIGTGTGIVTGISPGSVVVTYSTTGAGCTVTAPMNVNAGPAAITGTFGVCVGATTALSDATPGGTWNSSNPAAATISPTGVVSGIAAGTTNISYIVTGTGCMATQLVTVNTLPGSISGTLQVCQGAGTTLSDATPAGSWGSSDPLTATVGATTGIVTGIVTGVTTPVPVTISYTLGAGCDATVVVTVNPIPSGISGPNTVCATQSITLTDATGGIWSSTAPTTGSVDAAGDVTGITAGTTTISYTNSYSCAATQQVTVNAMPGPILGGPNVCLGGTTLFTDAVTGGTWFSSNPTVATVGSSSGIVSGITLGSATLIYQLPPSGSCFVTKLINVYPLPLVFTVTGGGNHCAGDTGVHIGLSNSTAGVNYFLYRGSTAVGTFAGTGTSMDLGLQTLAGIYTVTGTSTATGCTVTMSGSATVGVNPSVTPTVIVHATPGNTVCSGATVNFTTTATNSGTAPVYQWSVNGYPVALTTGYTYIPADGDVVRVKITSSATCAIPPSVKDSAVMHVQPFAGPTVGLTITPDDTVCQGTVVSVHAVPEYGGTAPVYTWVKNGAPVAVATTSGVYSWSPSDGDVIYAAMSSNYPCRLSDHDTSSLLRVRVEAPVTPLITITANPGVYIGPGQSDTLTATVTGAVAPTYQWYVNGVPVPGATTDVFISSSFSSPEEDSVSCMVTSNGVCPATTHQWVYIDVTTVKVQQLGLGSDINVVPNPNKGEFMIRGTLGVTTDEEVALELTDMLGQVVYKNTVTAKGGKLNERVQVSNLANGMYMLTVRSATGSRVFHVVVEQ